VASLLVPAAAAAAAAMAATLLWPRFATETLGLHGTVLPSPSCSSDWPALGRVRPLATASIGKRLHHLVAAWQASVGWGKNFQVWLGGARWVYIADLADGRYLTQRLNPPRAPKIMRWFGELITPRMVFLVGNEEHVKVRKIAHMALLTSATADTVTAAVGDLLLSGTPGSPSGSARSYQGKVLDAAIAAGDPLDLDAWAVDVTLGVMFRVLFSETPPREVVDGTRHAMSEWIDAMSMVTGMPTPAVMSFGARRRIRAAGDWLVDLFEAAVGRRRAAWANGSRPVPPPAGAPEPPGGLDMLDVMLRDRDGGGIYAGDERRLYADLAMYLLGGHDTTVCVWGGGGVPCIVAVGTPRGAGRLGLGGGCVAAWGLATDDHNVHCSHPPCSSHRPHASAHAPLPMAPPSPTRRPTAWRLPSTPSPPTPTWRRASSPKPTRSCRPPPTR